MVTAEEMIGTTKISEKKFEEQGRPVAARNYNN